MNGLVWAIAFWAGIELSSDQGGTWTKPTMVPADYARGGAGRTIRS